MAEPLARIVLRPLGTPLPLGFLGLLVATTCFSGLQLGWLPPQEGRSVALGLLAFTVPSQLIAAVLGFLARDPVAGTGMAVLAGTWGATGLTVLTSPPGATSPGLGVLLLAASAAMLVPTAAATTKLAAAAVMGTTVVRFAVTGVYELTADPAWQMAAGVVGLVLAAVALYAALGFELEDVRHSTVVPLGRRGAGSDVMTAGVEQEVATVQNEAGVRRQL
jgi:succinate-acetate transporter protein